MKNILIAVLVMVSMFMAYPAFAKNLEMLDEMTLGAKVQSQDLILKSKHFDLGAEIGTKDLTNSDTIKNSFYAMGVVTVKAWTLFDLTD